MWNKNTLIKLITQTITQDSDGFDSITETETGVYAAIDSITGAEFYQTGLLDIKPSCRATIWTAEYSGQTIVKIGSDRYSVYRTYQRSLDEIELYLEKKAGAN